VRDKRSFHAIAEKLRKEEARLRGPTSGLEIQAHQRQGLAEIDGDLDGFDHADARALLENRECLIELRELTYEARRLKAKAEREGDLRTALAAVRELYRIVELMARLRGELREGVEARILNVHLDPETARRIADTFLARHPKPEVIK